VALRARDEPEPPQEPERRGVVGERARGQPDESVCARTFDDPGRQRAADAVALPIVEHRHRELGGIVDLREGGIPGLGDDPTVARVDRDERLALAVVDVGETGELRLA